MDDGVNGRLDVNRGARDLTKMMDRVVLWVRVRRVHEQLAC